MLVYEEEYYSITTYNNNILSFCLRLSVCVCVCLFVSACLCLSSPPHPSPCPLPALSLPAPSQSHVRPSHPLFFSQRTSSATSPLTTSAHAWRKGKAGSTAAPLARYDEGKGKLPMAIVSKAIAKYSFSAATSPSSARGPHIWNAEARVARPAAVPPSLAMAGHADRMLPAQAAAVGGRMGRWMRGREGLADERTRFTHGKSGGGGRVGLLGCCTSVSWVTCG